MRKTLSVMMLVATILTLIGAVGCTAIDGPSPEESKGIQILEKPDPTTLKIYGVVDTYCLIGKEALARADELILEQLKLQALQEYPDTTVLFCVYLKQGSTSSSYWASGIAASRRGS